MRVLICVLSASLASFVAEAVEIVGSGTPKTTQAKPKAAKKHESSTAPSNNGSPSADETIDWLNANIQRQTYILCFGKTGYASTKTETSLSMEEGMLVITEKLFSSGSSREEGPPKVQVTTLDRKKATNVVRIRAARSGSGDSCSDLAPNVEFVIGCQTPGCFNGAQSGTELVIKTDTDPRGQAQSVVTALEHLLKLGGAKKSLF